ncbi:hypothetical protein BS47DRAFT_1335324 [Hydnum rufescens UP504]|uniref:Uncharacterized protein n=1 Tax=Hydnum rufescens UP504 TaxID=1448309 RepID=A0A9P6BC01_9AGAM|nr:hypothetical protein BS47DRAFT_1335324 [Hydnum rufescens UP504]
MFRHFWRSLTKSKASSQTSDVPRNHGCWPRRLQNTICSVESGSKGVCSILCGSKALGLKASSQGDKAADCA